MAAGICGNLLVLAVFKYLPAVSDKAGFALPVGLSFYVLSTDAAGKSRMTGSEIMCFM